MKNIWSIVCKTSITDQDTNSISILESLEEINVPYRNKIDTKLVKIIPINFHVVSLWFDENTSKNRKFDVTVEVVDSKNKTIKDFLQECIMPQNKKRLRVITKINGFGFINKGIYKIKVKYREGNKPYKTVSEIPIDINLTKIE